MCEFSQRRLRKELTLGLILITAQPLNTATFNSLADPEVTLNHLIYNCSKHRTVASTLYKSNLQLSNKSSLEINQGIF